MQNQCDTTSGAREKLVVLNYFALRVWNLIVAGIWICVLDITIKNTWAN